MSQEKEINLYSIAGSGGTGGASGNYSQEIMPEEMPIMVMEWASAYRIRTDDVVVPEFDLSSYA